MTLASWRFLFLTFFVPMSTKITNILILLLILTGFLVSLFLYSQLPEQMASHWNMRGEVDGYLPKIYGAFLLPIISIILFLVFLLIPKLDPLKTNLQLFRTEYNLLVAMVIILLLYIHVLSLWSNLASGVDVVGMILPAVAVLFFALARVLGKSKRNWFVGIRTPWTLSSDIVWDKTHQLAKWLFVFAGFVILAGWFFRDYAFELLIFSILIAVLLPVLYSYWLFQKQSKT